TTAAPGFDEPPVPSVQLTSHPAAILLRRAAMKTKEMRMKWKSVSDDGDFLKWGDVAAGYELLGKYLGTKPGKFGKLGLLQADDEDRRRSRSPCRSSWNGN